MAKPYREGQGWAVRLRIAGQDLYLSGFASEAAARKVVAEKRRLLADLGKPAGLGPWRTTLGQALQRYARERLPFLKGARQNADRINRYLRTLGLDLIKLHAPAPARAGASGKGARWKVEFVPCEPTCRVPRGLWEHRRTQQRRTQASDRERARLARTLMSEVSPHQVQALIDAMRADGYEAATVALERAELRALFNYARRVWKWPEPTGNPATGLNMPRVDNARDRVLSNGEWERLTTALRECLNPYVAPALALLLETAMRSSEVLLEAKWEDVEWKRCVLKLGDAKAGKRTVPLTPAAMAVLAALKARAGDGEATGRILPISYEALKASWNRACERAGIEGATIHDLRHTGATRFALEYHGNVPLLKVITGHKTDVQLQRYVNIKVDDVVRLMHGQALDVEDAPAGLTAVRLKALLGPQAPVEAEKAEMPLPDNVVRVDFVRRSA